MADAEFYRLASDCPAAGRREPKPPSGLMGCGPRSAKATGLKTGVSFRSGRSRHIGNRDRRVAVLPIPPRGQRRAEHRGRRWVKGETLKPETGKTRNNGTKVIREFRERTPIFFDHTRKTENRKRKYKGMKTFTRIARINRELFLTAHKHRWTRIFEQRMFNRREPRERRPLPKAESGKRRTEIQLPRKGTKGT